MQLRISSKPADQAQEVYMRIFASCQCADCACAIYAGAGEAHVARVTFANLL